MTAFGAAMPTGGPVEEMIELAGGLERLGCRWLWVNDDRLAKDPFALLAAAALRTNSIGLGPGVTNPYSRHPALLAASIATVDELSGGRAVLGLGAGGTNHRMLQIDRRAPADAMRDAIALIRGLLAGERVTVEGAAVRAREAELDFEPTRRRIPIYIGARGPKLLELGGELADGVIVGNLATVRGWEYALERVRAGARRSGRELGEFELLAWLYTAIDDEPAAARDAVRPMVATTLVTSRSIVDQLGLELPERFAQTMARADWQLASSVIGPASEQVPDELVDKLALAGTAEHCRAALSQLLAAVPEITGVVAVPFPTPTATRARVLERFVIEVVGGSEVVVGGSKPARTPGDGGLAHQAERVRG